jgi:hypothetical protein
MKKIILVLVILFSLQMAGQKKTTEKISIKTIVKEQTIKGYLIIYIDKDHKATKTIRVDTFEELKALNVMRKANGLIKHKDIPKDFLLSGEYLKNGAKE